MKKGTLKTEHNTKLCTWYSTIPFYRKFFLICPNFNSKGVLLIMDYPRGRKKIVFNSYFVENSKKFSIFTKSPKKCAEFLNFLGFYKIFRNFLVFFLPFSIFLIFFKCSTKFKNILENTRKFKNSPNLSELFVKIRICLEFSRK